MTAKFTNEKPAEAVKSPAPPPAPTSTSTRGSATLADAVDRLILPELHKQFAEQREFLEKHLNEAFSSSPPARTEILTSGVQYGPDLSDRDALKAKARAVIEKTLNAHSVPVHRDVIHYLTDAIAEAFYVAPPVKPEDVLGVG